MRERQGTNGAMWNGAYFSDLSLLDWVGVALLTPLLLALVTLIVYLIAGMIGSIPRRRRLARQRSREAKAGGKRAAAPRQTPGD